MSEIYDVPGGCVHFIAEIWDKCSHDEVLSLQPMIPPKRFDIFPPLTGERSEGLDAFIFFFKNRL